ncbi:MAG: transposase [Bacteroidales bacterium]|nr:transposase [Bacteroidales bacterium]
MDQTKTKHPEHRYIKGLDRSQGFLLPPSLEELVEADSPVRVVDAFVDSLDVAKLGFTHIRRRPKGDAGRPSWEPADMLKLYLYGYLNRTRSTRKLQTECKRNLEVMCLRTEVLRHTGVDAGGATAKVQGHCLFQGRKRKRHPPGLPAVLLVVRSFLGYGPLQKCTSLHDKTNHFFKIPVSPSGVLKRQWGDDHFLV